jgi:molybdopterin/thiamine biosynthesis adenylyltransferase
VSSKTHQLTAEEKSIYEWQMWVDDFGEEGQRILKSSHVLISRVGGLGGVVAYELAAAGVGQITLAHAGNIKPSDLNRQLLMTHARIGSPRVDCAAERLRQLNPYLGVTPVAENVSLENVEALSEGVDLIVDCAPLFSERFALNTAAMRNNIPLVECAMYELEFHITSMIPKQTPCLRCLYPEDVQHWKREFPVFGAVSATVGALGAMEAIKILTGVGNPLFGQLLRGDLRTMKFQSVKINSNPQCATCGSPTPI